MKLWCCLVLSLLVACGSKSASKDEGKPGDPPVTKPAPPKPIAVAFVFEGHEMWLGNDDVPEMTEERIDRYVGILKSFKLAFASVPLKDLPAGSMATVVTYGENASVRRPMGPIETMTAEAFGQQKDYFGVIDRNLVAGVTLGLDELAKVGDARRILFVIGDGTDRNLGAVGVDLDSLAKRAATEKVQIVSIVYKGQLSEPGNDISALDPNLVTANTADQIVDHLRSTLDELAHPPVVSPVGGPTPPFALALVLAGQEVWVGNDEIEADEAARHKGALGAIRAAFDRAPMTGFPAGSQAMVITYDDKARFRAALMPIEKLDAKAIGTQKDSYRTIGTDLVAGVRLAIAELGKLQSERRVVVVLGDGNDTNNETAKPGLAQLAKKAADLHIEVYALVWKGDLSDPGSVITALDPKATTAATTDELTADLVALFRVLRNR